MKKALLVLLAGWLFFIAPGDQVSDGPVPQFRDLFNGKAGVSPEMAIRLSKAFGSTPESWIRMQAAYDLAQVQAREGQIKIERYEPPPTA